MKQFLPVFLMAAASAWASVDTGLIALVPASAKVVAGMDVIQCRSSPFGQYLLAKFQANDPHFEQFMDQLGFDPRRDLDSVVIASADDSGRNSAYAILARGSFDQSKISALAVSKGAAASTFQGVNLLASKEKNGQQVTLAFPDTGIAVMGDLASVQQVIQNLTTPSTLDVSLMNRIEQAGTANDAWFASILPGGALIGKQLASTTGQSGANGQGVGQMQALQAIRAASGGVKFGPTVAVTFDAGTRSEQDASSLSDVFRFFVSMVQMQRQQSAQASTLAGALDNLQISTNGDDVHVAFSVTEQSLEQIAEAGSKARAAHGSVAPVQ